MLQHAIQSFQNCRSWRHPLHPVVAYHVIQLIQLVNFDAAVIKLYLNSLFLIIAALDEAINPAEIKAVNDASKLLALIEGSSYTFAC